MKNDTGLVADSPSGDSAVPVQEYYVFCTKRDETIGWMDGCILWWRHEGRGYTYDLNFAGIFTDGHKAKHYPDPSICTYVPRDLVDANSYSPRLAFWDRTRSGVERPICEVIETSRISARGPDGGRASNAEAGNPKEGEAKVDE